MVNPKFININEESVKLATKMEIEKRASHKVPDFV